MSERKTYRVTTVPWEQGLELHVEGVGVTQSRSMQDAEMMARDYICQVLEVTGDSFDLKIISVAELQRLAEAWRAPNQCPECRSYRLDGEPPYLHVRGCSRTESSEESIRRSIAQEQERS